MEDLESSSGVLGRWLAMGRSENDLERALRREDSAPPPGSVVRGWQDPWESSGQLVLEGSRKKGLLGHGAQALTAALSCCVTLAEPHPRKRCWGGCFFPHILRAPVPQTPPSLPPLPPPCVSPGVATGGGVRTAGLWSLVQGEAMSAVWGQACLPGCPGD